ncbi:single-stranded DNA-binding protein WHY2 [Populus alba x Populus x berolinensis]|nr:single-stranded DNA-binding protein WHY2 [Populus alba x Populus x berolinensis]
MMKLSRLLNSNRNAVGKPTDVRDGSALHALTFQVGISTGGKSSIQDRVFAPYSVFKGKAALSVEPVLPTFSKFGSGNLRVDRRGSMMLTFLPAIGERKYDYEKRQKFALSATEVGSLISTGPKDSCEFFHDPSMLSSNAGQVRKNLSIKPHADGSGYFVSLSCLTEFHSWTIF